MAAGAREWDGDKAGEVMGRAEAGGVSFYTGCSWKTQWCLTEN